MCVIDIIIIVIIIIMIAETKLDIFEKGVTRTHLMFGMLAYCKASTCLRSSSLRLSSRSGLVSRGFGLSSFGFRSGPGAHARGGWGWWWGGRRAAG